VSDWVKEVKRVSSLLAKQTSPQFGWQSGYGVFGVDQNSLDRVENYVRSQEEHHLNASFEDELRALLMEHRLTWDERYLWD